MRDKLNIFLMKLFLKKFLLIKMICAALTDDTVEGMVESAENMGAEVVELRLDYLRDRGNLGRLSEIKQEKIVTCMPEWEGGFFQGYEKERIRILKKSLSFADYVTIELKTNPIMREKLVGAAKAEGVKVIVGYHDFERTPARDEIQKILKFSAAAGADISKIAFTPQNYKDVLNTLHPLLENKQNTPIISVSMGEMGKVSRILAPLLGSQITFASAKEGAESAPGQIRTDELSQILASLKK